MLAIWKGEAVWKSTICQSGDKCWLKGELWIIMWKYKYRIWIWGILLRWAECKTELHKREWKLLSYAVLKASSVDDGAPFRPPKDLLASRLMHLVNVQSRCALFQTKPLELLNPNQAVPNVMESNADFSGFEKFISPFFTNLCVGASVVHLSGWIKLEGKDK